MHPGCPFANAAPRPSCRGAFLHPATGLRAPPKGSSLRWSLLPPTVLPSTLGLHLTRRSSGPPPAKRLGRDAVSDIIVLAAQALCRWRPLSSNVRPHMRFRVTSVAGSDEGARLNAATVKLEDQLNAELGAQQFGSNLSQLTLVVVAVYDEPEQNEHWCKAHRKLATAKHPMTGEAMRYLSIAVPLVPKLVMAASDTTLEGLVARAAVRAVAIRPDRVPAGLDFTRLSRTVEASLMRSVRNAV
jgi:hypothetical protein